MSDASFTVVQQDPSRPARVLVQPRGALSAGAAEELSCGTLEHVGAAATAGVGAGPGVVVVFDLREVTGTEPGARAALTRLQAELSRRVRRTVYLAQRPSLRALARRCAHDAGDDGAGVAATEQQVEDWLSLIDGRRKHQARRMRTHFECVEKTLAYERSRRGGRS